MAKHQWDTSFLQDFVPQPILELIHSLPLPTLETLDDIPFWPSSSSECITKEAYLTLTSEAQSAMPFLSLDWLWHLNIAPSSQFFFLWKVCHNRLATKSNLHWLTHKSCPICQSEIETLDHVLRKCFFAQILWFEDFFHGSLSSWVQGSLSFYLLKVTPNLQWSVVLAYATWNLWTYRNAQIF